MKKIIPGSYPKLTFDNLEQIMRQRILLTRNDETAVPMLWQGIMELEFTANDEQRRALIYIPENTPSGTTFVLMNLPDGDDPAAFLQESGWIRQADSAKICLFLALPANDGWGTAEKELSFFRSCLKEMLKGVYFRIGMCTCVVGYGETGKALHTMALTDPLHVIAAVFCDAGNIDPAFLEDLRERSLDTPERTYGVGLHEIPVPVWIQESRLTQQARVTAAYWAEAICEENTPASEDPVWGSIWSQNKDTVCTPDSSIGKVCLKEVRGSFSDPSRTQQILCFLTQYSRYSKEGPIGNTLVPRVNNILAGENVRYFADERGIRRECLIYVPDSVREAARAGQKSPAVVAIHGANESIRNYVEESMWYRIAEEEHFILVMPEGTLEHVPDMLTGHTPIAYRPLWRVLNEADRAADLVYFEQILDALVSEYPADTSRLYLTGHSMGCMMTNFIGSSFLGHRFAALAGNSGTLAYWEASGSERIPVWLNMGQYDLWSSDISEESELTAALDQWLVRNKIADPQNVRQVRISGASESYTEGRYNGSVWKDDNGIPMVTYEWIRGKDHMVTEADSRRFWNKWFSRWTLGKNGERIFR